MTGPFPRRPRVYYNSAVSFDSRRGAPTRLFRVICNPEPTIGERLFLGRGYSLAIQNLRKMVFARINPRIYTGARSNAFNKRDGLVGAHRSTGIMTVLFEIKYQQDT